jgi:hypothetical protein
MVSGRLASPVRADPARQEKAVTFSTTSPGSERRLGRLGRARNPNNLYYSIACDEWPKMHWNK